MFSCFLSQPTADDQRYPSTCPYLIEDHIRFQCKLGDFFSGIMAIQFSVINAYVDNVSGIEIVNIALKGRAPASSIVLKKIGAIFPAIQIPPSVC